MENSKSTQPELPLEIERKFLIRFPDLNWLDRVADRSQITQTYLLDEKGVSARVRKREWPDRCVYTHTRKQKITLRRRVEQEREITLEEYQLLLEQADPKRSPLFKTRYCLPYCGQLLEIDVFPFWKKQAFLEIELDEEDAEVIIPPQLSVLREVSDDKHYTNAALAKRIPSEEA